MTPDRRVPAERAGEGVTALAATGLVVFASHRFFTPIDLPGALFIALGGFAVYFTDHTWHGGAILHRALSLLSVPVFLVPFFVHSSLRPEILILYLAAGILYITTPVPGCGRLQDYPVPRLILIIAGWTLLPTLLRSFVWSSSVIQYFTAIAACLTVNLLLCDHRDKQSDHAEDRPTLIHSLPATQLIPLLALLLAASLPLFVLSGTTILIPIPLLLGLHLLRTPNRPNKTLVDAIFLWTFPATLLIYH